ncbi:MAG: M36 family metallopeptidase [Rhodothermales bacterium]|nr:M36 family metallopeptidase [Rhodothermales bacterium]
MQKQRILLALMLLSYVFQPLSQVHAQQLSSDATARFIKEHAQALGITQADLASLVVTDQYVSKHNGVTHIILQQFFEEVPVFGAQINLSITAEGQILHVANRFRPEIAKSIRSKTRSLGPQEAVHEAARKLELEVSETLTIQPTPRNLAQRKARSPYDVVLSRGGIALEPIRADLVYLPTTTGEIYLVWNVGIYSEDGQHYWSSFVDAITGEVIQTTDLVVHEHGGVFEDPATSFVSQVREYVAQVPMIPYAHTLPSAPSAAPPNGGSYRVYPAPVESPSHAGNPYVDLRELVSNPADPIASPLGWHKDGTTTFTTTRGNNVHAYTDVNADGIPDPGSDPSGGSNLVFDFPLDFTQGPATYRDAAVTNLFYWNNLTHDIAYQYGFDEAAGNFQTKNIGNKGLGGDYVRAEAQDGSGTNNANFFTPVDGLPPRMQMFVWTTGLPNELVVGAPVNATYAMSGAAFGPALNLTGVSGAIVVADDGSGTTSDGCGSLINAAAIAGNIALIDRGTCSFVTKARNAQVAGATAVVIVNNVATPAVITLGNDGTGGDIIIPSGMISLADGAVIKAAIPVNGTARSNTTNPPARDSDFDNGIIVHEYAHGISNRLTGGPSQSTCLANFLVNGQVDGEQMGEGWSDYFALMLTDLNADNRGIGTYAVFQPPSGGGIRPFLYSTSTAINPSTYATINSPTITVPHGVGTVWATMLWDMTRALIDQHGFDPDLYKGDGGNNLAIQLVTDGMKLQPCNPGFVDGRDAILAADAVLTRGENTCSIWTAFAKRGLGYSADQGAFFTRFDGTEAFDLPPLCGLIAEVDALLSNGTLDNGQHNSLLSKLLQVQEKIAEGQTNVAINVLNAFISEVNELVTEGVLTAAQGQTLIDGAAAVIVQLGGSAPVSKLAEAPAEMSLSLQADLPKEFAIEQNYPNPFNPTTRIRFALPEATVVRLYVYDVMGREVERLVEGNMQAGYHEVSFGNDQLPSGIYFYRIEAGTFVDVKRMVLVK